jgi:hypothetical protein
LITAFWVELLLLNQIHKGLGFIQETWLIDVNVVLVVMKQISEETTSANMQRSHHEYASRPDAKASSDHLSS